MKVAGMIYLVYRTGEIAQGLQYSGRPMRDKLLRGWKAQYGPAYQHCCIQIAPQVDEEKVNQDGTNKVNKFGDKTLKKDFNLAFRI